MHEDTTTDPADRLEYCRVYSVTYSIRGRDKKLISTIRGVCVIAKDVADLSDQIRTIILGKEVRVRNGDGNRHDVIEHIEIESAALVGRLHGITEEAFNLIQKCGEQD